jgi:hypothetical protein
VVALLRERQHSLEMARDAHAKRQDGALEETNRAVDGQEAAAR